MKSVFLFVFLFLATGVNAYNPEDSIKIVSLLAEYKQQKTNKNAMIFFANSFLEVPYVAHTLEVNDEERLVINTRQMDCTTFVENVLALTLCAKNNKYSFLDFCEMLRKIRYRDGVVSYPDRNHYFTQWIISNEKQKLIKSADSSLPPFTATQIVNVDYMTTHVSSYKMLNNNPAWIKDIRKREKEISGLKYKYIPKNAINNSRLLRNTISTGDIIAILTKKKGLDTTHIGIAVWKKDGLHLLNASQIHKKVLLEPMLFKDYMKKHPSQIGIRICKVAE